MQKIKSRIPNTYYIIGLILLATVLIYWGMDTEQGLYQWQWKRALSYVFTWKDGSLTIGPLIYALKMSLYIIGVSFILSITIGLSTACLRYLPSILGKSISLAYIALVRNTPLLIQIFIMYFIVAPLFRLSPFWAAVWALALFEGAYMAEIFRAGISSIDKGQWDAGQSLGLNLSQTFKNVIFIQVLRKILAPLTNQSVSLVKDSALVSAIALPDLTLKAQELIAESFLSLEIWSIVAVLYILLSLLVTIPAKIIEKNYTWQWL